MPGEGRGVDAEGQLERRLLDLDRRQRLGRARIGQRRADLGIGEAGHGHDVAGDGLFDPPLAESLERGQVGDPLARLGAVRRDVDQRLAGPDHAAVDPADRDPAPVRVVVERADQHLDRRLGLDLRRGNRVDDRVEQRAQVVLELIRRETGPALLGDRVDDREIELVGVGREVEEEIVRQLDHLIAARGRAIDLVDDHDRRQPERQRALQHGPRLRHRPLDGVDQQQAAIGHVQDALDLPAEIGVAGRVDDVDLEAAVGDGHVLGEDRDPPLALEVVRIGDQLTGRIRVAEDVRLLEQPIDERGLAVVDVGDDGDVAQLGRRDRRRGRRSGCFHEVS